MGDGVLLFSWAKCSCFIYLWGEKMDIRNTVNRRVVITGIGPISPVGIGKHDFWESIKHGVTNFREVTRYPVDKFKTKIAAEMDVFVPELVDGKLTKAPEGFKGLDVSKFVNPKTFRKIENFGVERGGWSIYYAIASAKLAMEDSGLDLSKENMERVGVTYAAASGDAQLIRGSKPVFELTQYGALGGLSGTIAYEYGIEGTGIPSAGACASASISMRSAYLEIMSGAQDVVITGACSAGLAWSGFFECCDEPAQGPMSQQNDLERPMKPFDKDRGGFILGEGAGALILEDLEHAKARGANIYAEVVGFGHSTDTATHLADVSKPGYIRAMRLAKENAGLTDEVLASSTVYMNTHGTSTRKNDVLESHAIAEVFGDSSKKFLVNSIKGTTGHAQEAASAHELISACISLQEGVVPPTVGLKEVDPECADLDYVRDEYRNADIDYVIKNASGCCGPYITTVLKRYTA